MLWRRFGSIYRDADDGAAGGGAAGDSTESAGSTEEGSTAASQNTSEGEKQYTKAELDKAAADARREGERRAKEAADRKRREEQMSEAEKLESQLKELQAKADEATKAANARVLKSAVRDALSEAGVKADRKDYAIRMLDIGDSAIGEDGEPDAKAIKEAVDKLVTDIPELLGSTTPSGGGDFGKPNSADTDTSIVGLLRDGRPEHALAAINKRDKIT